MLNWLVALAGNATRLTRADLWLCVVQSVIGLRSPPLASARTDSLDQAIPRRRTLTLCFLERSLSLAPKETGFVCVLARTI